ncbi:MAG: cyclic nucleotide-binding domain-containing protein [Actinomycetota bacterium]
MLGTIIGVLAILLLASVILGNVFASHRRKAVRARNSVYAAVRTELAASPNGHRGSPARELPPQQEDVETDVYGRLSELVDPAEFRPQLAPDIEVKVFRLKWGNDYTMVANPRDILHYQFEADAADIIALMDGTRTVKEIVVERFQDSGDLELTRVAEIMQALLVGNFLVTPFVDSEQLVRDRLDPASATRKKLRGFAKTLSIEWDHADRFVRWFYDHGLKYWFTWPAQFVSVAICIAGFVAFWELVHSHRFALGGGTVALAFIVLTVLDYASTFVHEMGHAIVLLRYGRQVKSAGFMVYFGSPAFFVEGSDGLMLERRQRILQALGGPYAETVMAGIAAMVAWAYPDFFLSKTLYQFAVLGYLVIFMNLVPLLELDGYWILSDVIQVPDLRPRSLAFIQHDMWHKIRTREGFTKQEWGLGLYGLLGVAFTIFSLYLSFFFWKQIFAGLLGKMWDGGVLGRAFLLLLALLIAGPLVRGAIGLVRAAGRRLGALGDRVRFKLETKWRVEAAELIDALPIFDDVPEDVLSDLAGRVKLRTFASGQPVVRQGERADAFYVVRSGTLNIVEEDPDGNDQVLRTITRGESFGELGLVEAAPRAATVRAVAESQLFEVDKGTFDRLLADMIHVPEFAPTLQAVNDLRELSAFSHLEPDELNELLEHGEWVNVPPGETIIEQGEAGDAFYAIRSGQMEVLKDGEQVGTVGPGSYVGEIALLLDVPRTATVRARTPVRAYRLDREGFDALVGDAFRKGSLETKVSLSRVQAN